MKFKIKKKYDTSNVDGSKMTFTITIKVDSIRINLCLFFA